MNPYLAGTGPEMVDAFEDYWRKPWDHVKTEGRVALLTICSHAKPYSKSYIHTEIRRGIWQASIPLELVQYTHLSSAGIVPAQVDMDYPFCAYDWNVAEATPSDIAYHEHKTEQRLREWYAEWGHAFAGVVVYLRPEGHTRRAVEASLIPAHFVRVDHYPPLAYVACPDIDDRLTAPANVNRLTLAIKRYLE